MSRRGSDLAAAIPMVGRAHGMDMERGTLSFSRTVPYRENRYQGHASTSTTRLQSELAAWMEFYSLWML